MAGGSDANQHHHRPAAASSSSAIVIIADDRSDWEHTRAAHVHASKLEWPSGEYIYLGFWRFCVILDNLV